MAMNIPGLTPNQWVTLAGTTLRTGSLPKVLPIEILI